MFLLENFLAMHFSVFLISTNAYSVPLLLTLLSYFDNSMSVTAIIPQHYLVSTLFLEH